MKSLEYFEINLSNLLNTKSLFLKPILKLLKKVTKKYKTSLVIMNLHNL